jgi:hypothetical protein
MTGVVTRHENINGPIAEGDPVRTAKGARFAGVVAVIFMTRQHELRAVVEAIDPAFAGTLHVYPLDQLVLDVP